jgi:hypothetical protein
MSIIPNHLDHHFEWGLNHALPALLMRMSILEKASGKELICSETAFFITNIKLQSVHFGQFGKQIED